MQKVFINQYSIWKKTFKTIHQLSCFVGHPVYNCINQLKHTESPCLQINVVSFCLVFNKPCSQCKNFFYLFKFFLKYTSCPILNNNYKELTVNFTKNLNLFYLILIKKATRTHIKKKQMTWMFNMRNMKPIKLRISYFEIETRGVKRGDKFVPVIWQFNPCLLYTSPSPRD